MIAAAWICLISPLVAAALITVGGNRTEDTVAVNDATASR